MDFPMMRANKLQSSATSSKARRLKRRADQVVRIHSHTQAVRQGKVIKETDDVRFAVTSYWPQEAGRTHYWNWPAAIGASRMGSTIGGIAPKTRTAAPCANRRSAQPAPVSLFGYLSVPEASQR